MDVKEIMTPKHKIFALPEELPVRKAIEKIKEKKFSRIPVYRDSLDQITGILYMRKIIPLKLKQRELDKPIKEFMDEPYFVTEFLTLDKLLEEMQRTKKHMAIVVDEYGNTAGLVTLDDILNEIVGGDQKESKELSEDRLRLAGDTPMEEVKELLRLREDEILTEVDTLAGLLMALTERIPKKGESICYQGYTFTVEETEGNRITSVIVEKKK